VKKIFQIAESVSWESGGLRTVLVNLDNYIKKNSSIILTNNKEKEDKYLDFPSSKFNFWSYSNELTQYLYSKINEIDILHLHGVFMHAHYTSSKLAQKNNIPYIVSPHGMLEPWHLNDKQLKKSVYLKLFLNYLLAKSKIIHAITPFEKENLYKLTGHKNIVEIPNFIDYSKLPNDLSYIPEEEYLLFLSRLHSKKGLDILIQSMSKIENKKIKLKIVGAENSYSNDLKKLCKELGVEDRIDFLGGIYGNEKYNLFANAKAFVAPSYSEAIGMVNLEAAACKTPVITTFNTGISPEWNNNGGIMIEPNTEQLTLALNTAVNWTVEERMQRGKLLSDFVINNYSWEKKGHLWDELYNSI
jgi:glycosyltransferase involved in cell wall biosynthesis